MSLVRLWGRGRMVDGKETFGYLGLMAGIHNSHSRGSLVQFQGIVRCAAEELEVNLNVVLRSLSGFSCCPAVLYWAMCSWSSFTLLLLKAGVIYLKRKLLLFYTFPVLFHTYACSVFWVSDLVLSRGWGGGNIGKEHGGHGGGYNVLPAWLAHYKYLLFHC